MSACAGGAGRWEHRPAPGPVRLVPALSQWSGGRSSSRSEPVRLSDAHVYTVRTYIKGRNSTLLDLTS